MAELLSTMPVMPLQPGMRVQFEAIDTTTGVAVAGVTVSLATLYVADSDDVPEGSVPELPPLLTYAPEALST